MKYFANYHVNGTCSVLPYVSHNKKKLCKDIREICKGEWSRGDLAHFEVINELEEIVFFGHILPNGATQYVTKNYVDKF